MIALDNWLKDGMKSKARALRIAGYGSSVINQPNKVFNSPAVIEELELRGYNKWGVSQPVKVVECKEEKEKLLLDLNNITQEQIINLKEQLAKIQDEPKPIKIENQIEHIHTPHGLRVDIFSEEAEYNKNTYIKPNDYSSM